MNHRLPRTETRDKRRGIDPAKRCGTSPSPFAAGPVLHRLRELNRRCGPVKAPVLADFLGKSERTARLYLAQLEQTGLVQRPLGPRSGWMVVR